MLEENKSVLLVCEEMADQRLDVYLSKVCEWITSRSFASKWIDAGHVLVDGKQRKPSFRLSVGCQVLLNLSFVDQGKNIPSAEQISLDILFEDEDVLVINKPAGMVVHPGAGVSSGTLVNAVLGHCGMTLPSLGEASRAGIVHRLDRDTSGVMVVAKSQKALTGLSVQFAKHEQMRKYHAIVYGGFDVPREQEHLLQTWHGRDPKNRIKYAVQPEGVGKKAVLHYRFMESFCENRLSLVECRLETGRTHQIRVQMASIGHGIVGDVLYATVNQAVRQQKELFSQIQKKTERQMLHALELGFKHPSSHEWMFFFAPYPKDFQTTLQWLRACNG